MATRRDLKKDVTYVTNQLFAECMFFNSFIPNIDKTKTDNLMSNILNIQDEFITRISHTEPGSVKAFYKTLRSDFDQEIGKITKEMNELNSKKD